MENFPFGPSDCRNKAFDEVVKNRIEYSAAMDELVHEKGIIIASEF